ncbi:MULTISPECIES: glycoside-pentoside-hexuronide (GPH):cation symporter [unclassified Facklamia]|uniref:MFS transporter n=1 Tax=Aerococcaceae TaxID=186827 RepID=UPI0013BCECF5|nr:MULTISPECIES: glycoside-pentoside-hexuronide (GPH):cation symporter [unclassified Facklamia]NEW64619.1 MFS transporter [Facklamia sp. 252]NEW67944.1 MFS transporter [Facklamia sp. 253]QQD65432.1 MFS transporter [Aerococcaceae bacterium zg-252]
MKEKNEIRPFSRQDQMGYIAGDMAGSFVNLTFDAFFLVFTTYVLKVNPKFMSGLFLFARLFDAINDPIIGSLPDRFRLSKVDKFKPWIKIAMWPLAISILMGFFDITIWNISESFKLIWVSAAYILYGMSYTGTSMPFGAMASAITRDTNERSQLSAARAIGGTIVGYGFLGFIPSLIWDKAGNANPKGYMLVAIVAAVLCIICYTILFRLTQERYSRIEIGDSVQNNVENQYRFFDVVKQAFQNRSLLGIMFASVGSLIYITGNSQFGGFLFKEFFQLPKMQSVAMYVQIPITFIMFILVPKITEKVDKRLFLTGILIWNAIIAGILFFVPIHNIWLYILLNSLGNLGQMSFIMLVWALVGDAIEFHQYKFGTRPDGTLYSIYTFSRKIGSTLASFGATGLLGIIGFVAGGEAQSAEVVSNIRYIATAIPLIASVMEVIGVYFIFNLTSEKNIQIAKENKAQIK